ncbi:MAG: NADPH-dependent glutamate synthase [Alistipes sp.]|nr:NADPH-dependent glutamate synthase [Alistipes sp.]
MANKIARLNAREQDPTLRAQNFEEVSYGFTADEARLEASRCLQCKHRPCVGACPVSIQIPDFIAEVRDGEFTKAADTIARDSLLPSVCGRVCPQESQCEGSCVLGIKGLPVNIGKLERFVGDTALAENSFKPVKAAPNGRKVAIIGSGPAGLACAADLAVKGYGVKMFEALHKPGGVLVYGIPEFRLPKDKIVAREIAKLSALGVEIETDVVVGRTITIDSLLDSTEQGGEGFSAVFVGSGAGLPYFMGIGGENLNGVVSANEFLTRANLMKAYDGGHDTPIFVGKRTVVVGGGNVAMDAVRTAKRLGSDAFIVYRRSEAELPARVEEVHHAKEEGIEFRMLTNPVEILGDEAGRVRAVRCVKMELGEPDASGRRSPVEVAGSEFEIECEAVIMALGTSPNPLIASTTPGLETNRRGGLIATEGGATSRAGVFAGGDAVTGAATVILAMGAGRKAAVAIDEYVAGLERFFWFE